MMMTARGSTELLQALQLSLSLGQIGCKDTIIALITLNAANASIFGGLIHTVIRT